MSTEQAKQAESHRIQLEKQLKEAETLLNTGKDGEAREMLKDILASNPDNARANELVYQARSTLNQQVNALLKLADGLYREGHLQAAISTWETVLQLSPGNPQAIEKLKRSRRVKEKLERLREVQQPESAPIPIRR